LIFMLENLKILLSSSFSICTRKSLDFGNRCTSFFFLWFRLQLPAANLVKKI
jgi:hypothetical protein